MNGEGAVFFIFYFPHFIFDFMSGIDRDKERERIGNLVHNKMILGEGNNNYII
jgi:hypothetical protein